MGFNLAKDKYGGVPRFNLGNTETDDLEVLISSALSFRFYFCLMSILVVAFL